MNVSSRQLNLFEAIARLGTLSAAATEQSISQSAASQSLKELERQLGYALFRKSGRELRITDAGLQALPMVRNTINNLQGLAFPKDDFVGGTLRISASETIASYVLPEVIARFVQRYPNVEPQLSVHNTETVVQEIEKGHSSIGFIEGPTHSSELFVQPWQQDQLQVFCTPETAKALSGKLTKRQLLEQRWIVREQGSGTRAVLNSGFAQVQVEPQHLMALPRQEAIKQMVRAGLGVGCLSAWAIKDELALEQLSLLDTPMVLKRTFSIIQPSVQSMSPLVKRFYEFTLDFC
jgi:DNA-binding transcriptional LysR family regulator